MITFLSLAVIALVAAGLFLIAWYLGEGGRR